jgi:methylmalonyl-CoA mutase
VPKLLEEFPPVSTADWESAIRADLKGSDYDKKLVWRTADGIALRPYYRAEDLAGLEFLDAVRGARAGNDWQIAGEPPARIDIDAARFEESGATTVQELGYALAEGIEFLAEQRPPGVTFCFAIGSSYFFQIAKLRAFRLLWAGVVEAFKLPELETTLHCRTSRWNKTIYDAHNNVLRATTEAMAAAIGGADSITVEPYDETFKQPDSPSRRLARNTQLILKHEAYLDRVADPAAGSYFIESLTASLAGAAWKLMQSIEEFGGFRKAHDSGMIPAEIAKARSEKEKAIAERRRVFVGVNQYPNPAERMLGKLEAHDSIDVRRGPEAFEDLRLRTEQSGRAPSILLAEIGDAKMRKARSQFMANFFGCAGFSVVTRTFERAADIAGTEADAIVLCSSDPEYLAAAAELAGALKNTGRATPVIVAGFPKESIEALKSAGVADFIHIRTNAAESLAAWQDRLGVRS